MAAKLTVHSVLGEGVKLIFDVPEAIQDCFDFQPNEVLDTHQLELMMAMARGSRNPRIEAAQARAKQTTNQIIEQLKKAANDC